MHNINGSVQEHWPRLTEATPSAGSFWLKASIEAC
jgi:hypothetical protein